MEKLHAAIDEAIKTATNHYNLTALILKDYETTDESNEAKAAYIFCQVLRDWIYTRQQMLNQLGSLIRTAHREIDNIEANLSISTKWLNADKYNDLVSESLSHQNHLKQINYVVGYNNLEAVFAKATNLINLEKHILVK